MFDGLIGKIVDWVLGQDPLFVLVLILLVRSEVRTREAQAAAKLLARTHIHHPHDSKETRS